MVALIEDQMHKFLVDQEEQRCRLIELDNPGMKVTRRKIQKPWTRPEHSTLCQDLALLIMVSEYDYRLSDAGFVDYCAKRGVLHVAGEPGSRRWGFMANYQKSKSDYLDDDPYFWFAEEVDGKRYRFTDEQMETGWRIITLGRAKLQDCWELYCRESPTADA